jgi:hypothetical protein
MVILLLACSGTEGTTAGGSVLVADYVMLGDGTSWTYRDDALGPESDSPAEEELLHARHVGDGVVEFRRGLRWADAIEEGKLVWSEADGLTLVEWDLGEAQGSGEIFMSAEVPEQMAMTVSGKYTCTTFMDAPVDTYYGTFELALVFDCNGGGMGGTYAFAYGWGLVQVDAGGIVLDLVGPW